MSRIRSWILVFGTLATVAGVPPTTLTAQTPEESYRVTLLRATLPGHDLEIADQISSALTDAGFDVSLIDGDDLCSVSVVNTDTCDLLVLPSAHALPVDSLDPLTAYIQEGGDILALRAPAYQTPLGKVGPKWLSRQDWREMLRAQQTEHLLFNFENEDLTAWERHTNEPESPFTAELDPGHDGKALHIHIGRMSGWDGLASPFLENPFPDGHELTCFYAKGAGETDTLSLEAVEKDGSRWIAVFPVTDTWQRIVLTPEDFDFWQSVPNRGHPGDRFNPQNAQRLKFGVAWTHTGQRGGEYEFYIDELGTASNPHGEFPALLRRIKPIEGLCPEYKFYTIHDIADLKTRGTIESLPMPVPADILAHHPRPTGKGFNKGRDSRWIPLIDALAPDQEWRGAPSVCVADFNGSLRTTFSVQNPTWYRDQIVREFIVGTVRRMAKGIFFQEAGSEFFTYRENTPVILGAQIANYSKTDSTNLTVEFTLRGDGTGSTIRISRPVAVSAGEVECISQPITLPDEANEFELTIQILEDRRVLDTIDQSLSVFRPKPESERVFITAHDGDFYLGKNKWYVHGVNYMPSTGIAIDNGSDFEYWIGKRPYDPEFIQRDLERCRNMGLNSVSIFLYHRSVDSYNLLDILRRCENLGLRVNLSIRPGTPMHYDWDAWKEIILKHRLWEIDTIYAYDIAWEPFFGTVEQRRQYDSQWREWIINKYGSISKAERQWSYSGPRFDGAVSTPTHEHLGEDGPHRTMVADYRQFVDELIHKKYAAAAQKIRKIDSNHLISFRMTVTGDPTFDGSRKMPYDFKGVAKCMDFLSPEGYGRIGDWERVKPGMFTVTYARYCAPDKPVLWAEAGVSTWNRQTRETDPDLLEFQGNYFADFYKMVIESYSNGIVWWWYPGGFRTNENSDFGIINPDGTDRPATKTIRRFADEVLAERTIPEPDYFIEVDRDADARGLFGMYKRVEDEYWNAVESGKTVGLQEKL